ncbi:glycine dehydrogenase subunit 2 [Sulfolobales archaeon HS-7]|nr:glycine dehydrogenase subunit 2 [Sulfolobales archaeon HS-7]
MWKQARWEEPLIHEIGDTRTNGFLISKEDVPDVASNVKSRAFKRTVVNMPGLHEIEVVRHFIRLSQMNFGVDNGIMPLGSCTMKYNPKAEVIGQELVETFHPSQDPSTVQGILETLYELQTIFEELTGMDRCSLAVPAGSSGELAGVLMIKKLNIDNGINKDEILVADTAHGTNPASASMAGFKVIYVKSNEEGLLDLNILKNIVSDKTAGLMLTNPNTLGLFEQNILEISKVVHEKGGKLYYDGANLNGILGIVRPGDMGFDIVHLNLHKTFAVPHGGGGPGAAAVCAKNELTDYLPSPVLIKQDNRILIKEPEKTIGKMSSYFGNVGNLVRAYVYLLGLGGEGVRSVAIMSTLATNYLITKLKGVEGLTLFPNNSRIRKHEVVFSAKNAKDSYGVSAEDIAKSILDYGIYAPTIYFPQLAEEAIMIEPTEGEPLYALELLAEALRKIMETARKEPEKIRMSPYNTSVRRIDNVYANKPTTITPTYRVLKRRERGENVTL